ncbi:MAG: prepilin-type N-terminal cleavage/methylation domain-containing protein [Candidatus Omnitrophica bacterium]|nr:prepilin-type N-terminal cleavage/methylation domain-containing protein [Candidatus Omnitrophota bacterium]
MVDLMEMVRSRSRSGFTLIELLIVIAIILILIAIALPNFLEAQVRAKLTNSYGQMRGIGQALEAYQSDWNRYPAVSFYEPTQFNPQIRSLGVNCYSLMQLTTPVPYLESVPLDIFFRKGDTTIFNDSTNSMTPVSPPDQQHGVTYLYWSQESLRYDRQIATADAMKRNGINWALVSLAPDQDLDTINLNPADMGALRINATKWNYSPTNGTKSSGDLTRAVP